MRRFIPQFTRLPQAWPFVAACAACLALTPGLVQAAVAAPAVMRTTLPPVTAAPVTAAPDTAAGASDDLSLGYDRLGVRRADSWRLSDSLGGGAAEVYAEGTAAWLPVAGDTDGDGVGTVSLFRDGVWRLRDQPRGPVRQVRFGAAGDVPVLGDWNGDGIDTIGLFRRGRWYLREVNGDAPSRTFGYGIPGDQPVVGDWDADGRTDIAVVRKSRWYQRDAASAGASARTFLFGLSGDLPVAGDWDHDGRDTPGVFRRGTWYVKQGNGFGTNQVAYFGQAGDRPVVRRTPVLAPGVRHQVIRRGAAVAHVLTVDLAAESSPDTVLAQNRLRGLETTSAMSRRSGAVAGINGDDALPSGRPVHLFADDGRLAQTPQLLGRAFGIDATGTRVQMGFPTVRIDVTAQVSDTETISIDVPRWNSGHPTDDVAAYTALGESLEIPPDGACYANLEPVATPRVDAGGAVRTPMTVTGARCEGAAPIVSPTGITLAATISQASDARIRSLRQGPAELSTLLGFPGAVDAMGGNPLLIRDGQQQQQDLTGPGGFFARNPRTAVGVTEDGRLLLVVVDGRQPGYSTGMNLQELAEVFTSLGARDAINLDGGGSSTMWLNGLVANRISDPRERPVSSALVVLPGADHGQTVAVSPGAAGLRGAGSGGPVTGPTRSSPSLTDPASTGGLADALDRAGVDLPPAMAKADQAYDARHAR